jgi:hypothetical protein
VLCPRQHFRREYAASFGYYAWQCPEALSRYRPEVLELNTQRQKQVCTRELFLHNQGSGATAAGPIFVVGLPRSGSTLIEQIPASHSAVEGTHEL